MRPSAGERQDPAPSGGHAGAGFGIPTPAGPYPRRVDSELQRAIASSHLGGVPGEVLTDLLGGAQQVVVPAGSVVHREGDPTTHLELVVSGALRILVRAPDGRTMTVRYCRQGALLGAVSLFRPTFAMPATAEALVETRVLRTDPQTVRRHVEDRHVARALSAELSERAVGFLHEIPGGVFGSVRQRVARHLLDLATVPGNGSAASEGRLVVVASQQDLAEAAGTVREVVVRILRELRDDGLVRTGRGRIELLDVARLVDEEIWNLSS